MGERKDKSLTKILFKELSDQNSEIIPIVADEEEELASSSIPGQLPILPLRNTVLFPGVVIPISVGRKRSLKLVREAYGDDQIIGTVTQKDETIDLPAFSDLYRVGTVARILKILELPDGSTTVIIQGKRRFEVKEFITAEPYIQAQVVALDEFREGTDSDEFGAIVESLKDLSVKVAKYSSNIPAEATFAVKNIANSTFLVNFICSNTDLKVEEKQKLLEIGGLRERGIQAMSYLVQEVQLLELKQDIQSKVKVELDQQQREFLLNQQMKTIQNELGGNPVEQEIEELKKKGAAKKWVDEVAAFFDKEVRKLSRLNPVAGEYSVQYSFCQTLLELPWNEYTEDNFNLKHAQSILDEDHYGLENVKERILEHLAVLKLKKDMKAPILCLYGPPGVGKTSLGKSIARALERKYVRMSLGGLHDESEIRGHRKTYIGAMPGRILQNIKKAGSANPVFILDEIDKVAGDFHGDPASALLEVLDPAQNNEFHDNYVEVDFDLSKVMFIATANSLNTISPALLDRLELIDVSGYIIEEKIEIAKRHLIPRELTEHGVTSDQLSFEENAVEYLIERYTLESGVRQLDKMLAKVIRRVARKIAFEEPYPSVMNRAAVRQFLGAEKFMPESYQGNNFTGVVTGLAWTAHGGEILFVESSLSRGKGNLTLTGNLGDVMKESAVLALEFLKSHTSELQIDPQIFEDKNFHVHVPEGAIPKDGPSAGVTMATSLASSLLGCKVRKNLAMTGEITLRGKVLPVGGIKEKILAAKRAGIKEIILSRDNEKDIGEIKAVYLKGLKFHYVETIQDVLDYALLKASLN